MDNPQVWVVRAGVNNEIASEVKKASVMAIGWDKMGNLAQLNTRGEFKDRYRSKYTVDSEAKVGIGAGQVYRFVREIETGDFALTPVTVSREVLIGEVIGEYVFDPQAISKNYPHVRKVNWLKKVSRDDLSTPFRNALGGIMTVFTVSDHLAEVKSLLGKGPPPPEPETPTQLIYEDVRAKADEMISDILSQIDAYDFQDLVAGLLKAMEFKTRVSAPGRDLGVDIIAFPDAFGFQSPRVKVQVKHRKGQATAPEVRQLAGTLRQNENGLFLSTGGFTTEALREPEKHTSITLIDRDHFVNLLLEHYERLEPQYQALVPLRKAYIPVPPDYTALKKPKK